MDADVDIDSYYLLLVLSPPTIKLGDCLLPSANEVVLGRPLMSSVLVF